jgi:uncharacterized protein YheU (UPF0270 family)
MPVTPVALDNAGELFYQPRAVVPDKGNDVRSFHQFDSTFTGTGLILTRIRLIQKEQDKKMAEFVAVPLQRLQERVLQALLEEFASRDGTDYGERELSLAQKVLALESQLKGGELQILYDADSEQWDLLPREQAATLLNNG